MNYTESVSYTHLFIDKILDKMRLNSEDDEEFDNEDYYLDDEEEEELDVYKRQVHGNGNCPECRITAEEIFIGRLAMNIGLVAHDSKKKLKMCIRDRM